jgi:L-lactate dehydrogenase complex protein LldF
VTELARPAGSFREQARRTLANEHTQEALDAATARLRTNRLVAWGELDDVEELREQGREARSRAIRNLDANVERFTTALEARGGRVHRAGDAAAASAAIVEICRAAGARTVAKSKSMASEEIGLNAALEAEEIRVVETDLGEYLLQLAGEHPVHIIAPAIEKTADDAARLLEAVDGRPVEPQLEALTARARELLRREFLGADVGVTGANFAVAETGSICLVENEGNGRLVSALPPVHVVILGLERFVETTADLAVCLRLLARSGTGQRLTTNTVLLTGPRREGEEDGPQELHVVIVDNGRGRIRGTKYEEMLNCIRCGACLNVCPVYRKAGGAAYGPVYSGPMGAVLVPLLARAPDLPQASSLCGACTEACPVKIPLHEYLLELRRGHADPPFHERAAFLLWSLAWSHPVGYRISTALARLAQPLAPRFARSWTVGRALPRLGRRYRDR